MNNKVRVPVKVKESLGFSFLMAKQGPKIASPYREGEVTEDEIREDETSRGWDQRGKGEKTVGDLIGHREDFDFFHNEIGRVLNSKVLQLGLCFRRISMVPCQ